MPFDPTPECETGRLNSPEGNSLENLDLQPQGWETKPKMRSLKTDLIGR